MYFAINRFTGDGTTTQWELNFSGGYISQDHVKVVVTSPEGVETTPTFTWVNTNTVSLTPAVASDYAIEFYRDTPKDLPLVDYTDGAIISEKNLDRTAQQTVFATAEIYDRLQDVLVESAQASEDSAEALATANSAITQVQQALDDSAEALATVAGAISAANSATASAAAATAAAGVATTAANDATAAANDAEDVAASALLVAEDAQSTANGIAATASAALSASAAATSTANNALSVANGIAATAQDALDTADAAAADAATALADATSALSSITTHLSSPTAHTKAQVGLSNVDNTSDVNKPISLATAAALDTKVTATAGPGGAAYSFRNKFINGGFGLWQRGSSFTVAAGSIVYTADRWGVSVAGSSVTCQLVDYGTDTGLVLTGAAGNTKTVVRQRIEAQNARSIAGKTVTLSFLGYHSDAMSISWEVNRANSADSFATVTGVASGSVAIPSGEFTYRTVSFSLPADAKNGIEVLLYVDGLLAGKQLAFRRMQLEEGAVATPFEDRPIGLELALCQRYYQIINPVYLFRSTTHEAYSGGIMQFGYNTRMRVTPSFVLTKTSGTWGGGVIGDCKESAGVVWFGSGGLVGDYSVMSIAMDAEL